MKSVCACAVTAIAQRSARCDSPPAITSVVESQSSSLVVGMGDLRLSGGRIGRALRNATAKVTLKVAVGVKTQRLQPGPLCLLRRPPKQLAKVVQGGRKLAVGWQRYRVNV